MWDTTGIPIGTKHDNTILDTRVYEVEYLDVHKASLAANNIAENIFSKVDEEANIFVPFDDIADHHVDSTENMQQDDFNISNNGDNRLRETTKGWEILIQWKDGSTTWDITKDVKKCYSLQLAKYSHQIRISQEPASAWWVPHLMKKRNQIISKVKSKYCTSTNKYGVRIPKSVKEEISINK